MSKHGFSNDPTQKFISVMFSLPLKSLESTTVLCGLASHLAKIKEMNKLLELMNSC